MTAINKFLSALSRVLYGKNFGTKSKTKWDYILIPFYALMLALVFRSLFFDNFHVPSGSMQNTLLVGDKITISKFSYGYSRYSFPFGVIPFEGRVLEKQPQRGDIVVFKYPGNRRINYVKRLIGLPGDTIRMSQGVLYINNQKIPKKFVATYEETDEYGESHKMQRYLETLPNGVSYEVLDEYDNAYADNTPEYTVPADHYLMLGDNRDHSQDSRFSIVGFVPKELLLGRVEKILISSPNSLLNVFAWHKIRFNRIWKDPMEIEVGEPDVVPDKKYT